MYMPDGIFPVNSLIFNVQRGRKWKYLGSFSRYDLYQFLTL